MAKRPPKHSEEWFRKVSAAPRTTAAAKERREKFLRVFGETGDIQTACDSVPVNYRTYLQWRLRYSDFKARVDSMKVGMTKADTAGQFEWREGFAEFRKQFFDMDSPWFHLEIIEALENAEPGSITLILMPPEHGKTTLLEDWANYKLAVDPTYRITFGSESVDHGKKVLGRVRGRMEADSPHGEYVARFGPFAPQTGGERKSKQPWGDTKFNVWRKGNFSIERDYSMRAIGIAGRVQGTRTDLLVMDDIQSLITLSQSQVYLDRFRQDWLTRSGAKAPVVIIGTRVGVDDFYEKLVATGIVTRIIKFPAWREDYGWLWPERNTEEEYATLRFNAGPETWSRNFMQDPMASASGPFAPEEVDAVKDKMRNTGDIAHDVAAMVIGLDPGYGRNAFLVGGMAETHLDVVDIQTDEDLRNTDNIIQLLEELLQTYHQWGKREVTHVVIEDKAFQKGLVEDEGLLDLVERYGFQVIGHDTGANKRDPNIGIPGMARSFRRKEVTIPWGDSETQEKMELLRKELVAWRAGMKGTELVQDLVMALWFSWIIWRDEKDTLAFQTSTTLQAGLGSWGERASGVLVPWSNGSPLRRSAA